MLISHTMKEPLQVLFEPVRTLTRKFLTLLKPLESSIKVDTVKSEWSIDYNEGLQAINSKNIIFLSLKIDFVLANSAAPYEMPL